MKAAEVRNMSETELAAKESDLRKELFNLKFRAATGEVENPMRIRAVRKDIARVMTIRTEKRKGAGADNK